jgi:hypothetical protein
VSFAAITICVASQRMFIVVTVYFVVDSVRRLLDTPIYEGRLKNSWTGGIAPLLRRGTHNSGALPSVHELFKRPS